MNIQSLMAEANKVQKELTKINEEIENSLFNGESGVIKVMVNGKNEVLKIDITDSTVLSDKEVLEDMIMLAVNDALSKVSKIKQEKLGKYTGGMGGLF